MCRAPGLEGFGSLSGLLGCTGRFPLQEKEPERTKARDDRDRDGKDFIAGFVSIRSPATEAYKSMRRG